MHGNDYRLLIYGFNFKHFILIGLFLFCFFQQGFSPEEGEERYVHRHLVGFFFSHKSFYPPPLKKFALKATFAAFALKVT